jgi:hypothetical protein
MTQGERRTGEIMVKQLFDIDAVKGELDAHPMQCVILTLAPEEVIRWKKMGHFGFIKAQLGRVHSLWFLCTKGRRSQYTFLMLSKALCARVTNMLDYLRNDDKHVPLVNCSPRFESKDVLKNVDGTIDITGAPTTCNLFS